MIVGVVLAGKYLVRPFLRLAVSARSSEVSTAAALFVVVGTAKLMELVGLSMALGAFLAGVLLADSEYRHELEANIQPFKGLLLGLFFMAIGMSAKLALFAQQPLLVVGMVLGLVALKAVVLFADRPDKGPVCAMGSQPSRQQITRYAKSTCGPM